MTYNNSWINKVSDWICIATNKYFSFEKKKARGTVSIQKNCEWCVLLKRGTDNGTESWMENGK